LFYVFDEAENCAAKWAPTDLKLELVPSATNELGSRLVWKGVSWGDPATNFTNSAAFEARQTIVWNKKGVARRGWK